MKSEVRKRRDTPCELRARILDAAARKKKREDQLGWTTRDLHARVVYGSEADRVLEHLLWTVTNLSFKH